MARVDVPDAVEGRNDILIEPADTDDVGGAIMRSKGYTANVAVDDEGQRYVGVHADKAADLMDRWGEKYGVEYDRDTGRIVSEGTPTTDAESDAESDGGGVTSETIQADADDSDDASGDAEEAETCETVKADGEVCGRELPCPYHSDDDTSDE